MAGEMNYINSETGEDDSGNVWNIHAAIAKAVGGTLKPFDQYQGPYIVVGTDITVGKSPYQLVPTHLGIIRLWVCEDVIYREDNEKTAPYFPYDELSAVDAALSLLEQSPKCAYQFSN